MAPFDTAENVQDPEAWALGERALRLDRQGSAAHLPELGLVARNNYRFARDPPLIGGYFTASTSRVASS